MNNLHLSLKAQPEGVLTGYASTFGNRDLVGDTVQSGAFATSVKALSSGSRIPLLWGHRQDEPIGRVVKAYEDERGLYVEAKLVSGVRKAEEALALAREDSAAFSIGFNIKDASPAQDGRLIKAAELHEVSVVGLPANPEARITGVKSLTGIGDLVDVIAAHFNISRREAKRLAQKGWHGLHGAESDNLQLADMIRASASKFTR